MKTLAVFSAGLLFASSFLPLSQEGCNAATDDDGDGYTITEGDCNDSDEAIHPDAAEKCDGIDNDCDYVVDEGANPGTYYPDADGDGYGDTNGGGYYCTPPVGYVPNELDCDDSDGAINPAATEVVDSKDNDCDRITDEGTLSVTLTGIPEGVTLNQFYLDLEADLGGYYWYGSLTFAKGVTQAKKDTPPELIHAYFSSLNGLDASGNSWACLPSDPDALQFTVVSLQTTEATIPLLCQQGNVTTYYRDADGDGYGDTYDSKEAFTQPVGYVANEMDCNDSNGAINPAATEVVDGLDNDCDRIKDEGSLSVTLTGVPQGVTLNQFYLDLETDLGGYYWYGSLAFAKGVTQAEKDTPPKLIHAYFSSINGSDTNGNSWACLPSDPDALQFTVVSLQTTEATIPLLCQEGSVTTYYRDADGDGYGETYDSVVAFTQPVGYVANELDCDDSDAAINPGATEVVDGKDNDCDKIEDEGTLRVTLTGIPQGVTLYPFNISIKNQFSYWLGSLTFEAGVTQAQGDVSSEAIYLYASTMGGVDANGESWACCLSNPDVLYEISPLETTEATVPLACWRE